MGNKDYCITDFKNLSIQVNFKITEIHTQKRYFPVAYVKKNAVYNLKKVVCTQKEKDAFLFSLSFTYLDNPKIPKNVNKMSGSLSHVHTPDIS